MRELRYFVVHYEGVEADSTPQEIAQWQTTKSDGVLFPEIAYHVVIRRDGMIYICHPWHMLTWHTGEGSGEYAGSKAGVSLNNWRSISVCFTGFGQGGMPSDQQIESGRFLIDQMIELMAEYYDAHLEIKGHKDLSPTACPGDRWLEWRKGLGAYSAYEEFLSRLI